MANQFPQLDNSQPILSPQKVSSSASSHEEFAKALGTIAEAGFKGAEKVEETQSNAMMLSSAANIDQLKISTQSLILTDPANATKHVETMRSSIEQVTANAYVNQTDRSKLKYYAQKATNGAELEAIKASVKQAQIGTAYEHYKNWPFQLNTLKSLINDPDKFEQQKDAMFKHVESIVLTGSITPLQGEAAIKSMTGVVDLAKYQHDLYNNEEAHTPQNFHAAMYNPVDKNKTNNLDYPVDETTRWAKNVHASDITFQGVMDDVKKNHLLPDVEAIEKLTPLQRDQLMLTMNGINQANAMINSGAPITQVASRLKELEGHNSYQAVAERDALKDYVTAVNSGDSQKLMAQTTMGGQIVRNWADKSSYLQNQLQNTDARDAQTIANLKSEMAKNDNDYANQSVAYAEAHHWPTVRPIPKADVDAVRNAFTVNADGSFPDPSVAYAVIKKYSPQNQMYLAQSMTNPRHRVVVQTVALGSTGQAGGNTDQENIDWIAANQPRNYKELDQSTEESIPDNYLKNSINTQITGAIKIISAQNNAIDATSLNGQLVQAGVNYAKYISEKSGQFSLKTDSTFGSVNNVGQVVSFINKSYEQMSGVNYIVNKKQVNIDKSQMDSVAQYAIDKGNDYRRAHMSESQFIAMQDQAPLTVTVTGTNHLVAKDPSGNIVYKRPMTTDLVAGAVSEVKKKIHAENKERIEFFKPISFQRKILGKGLNFGEEYAQ